MHGVSKRLSGEATLEDGEREHPGGGPSKRGAPAPSAGGRSGKAGRGLERSERAGGCGLRRVWGTEWLLLFRFLWKRLAGPS